MQVKEGNLNDLTCFYERPILHVVEYGKILEGEMREEILKKFHFPLEI